MDRHYRVVTHLPLTELWDERRDYPEARCLGTLTRDAVRQVLAEGPVRFVVADVGQALAWVEPAARYSFWRSVSSHVAPYPERLDGEADGQVLLAWRWDVPDSEPVIVLQKVH